MTRIYIDEEIEAVVAKTATVLGLNIKFMFGHWLEIEARLKELTDSITLGPTKFPLVALITDIPVIKGRIIGMYGEAELRIIIANWTEQNYTSTQRKEINFKPVLHPITDELLEQLAIHKTFTRKDVLQFTETDRYYWGKAEKSVFNDRIDAVELQNIKLNIKNYSCLPAADAELAAAS